MPPAREGAETAVTEHPPGIVVAIPCYNEAAAVASVIAEWRNALPGAEIVVFDNNSTDGTGDRAREAGVEVIPVPDQGKGCVVRAIFRAFQDRPAVILIDGDGTYPASAVPPLLDEVLSSRCDMAVMARRPEAAPGSMTPVRGLGNILIRAAFRALLGRGSDDPLSGGRVVGPKYLRAVAPKSTGFEIEVELEGEALRHGLKVASLPTPYLPRIAGTRSKLNPLRDGVRILLAIIRQGWRSRPWRLLGLSLAGLALAGGLIALGVIWARA
jgi:glycosyltransferase involved in cell wall biosynthesis